MTNEILNATLCQQILKEQKNRQWLLTQPAEEFYDIHTSTISDKPSFAHLSTTLNSEK